MGKYIIYINYNDVLENTGMFRFAAIEILSPHAGTPYMESCRKLVIVLQSINRLSKLKLLEKSCM